MRHELFQTLHGYRQGHRLLAMAGDLNSDEQALLERLSDLSGYLPAGAHFTHYYTGFPCGRYYAFACTWPDSAAQRTGTVLTHTLLVPRAALPLVDDLFALRAEHRQPKAARDLDDYARPITLSTFPDYKRAVDLGENRARAALGLLFGQKARPLLWVDGQQPHDVIGYLWTLLWPEARQSFSFCTFAMQVRHLERRPFTFLGLPPSVRGAFHEQAASPAWWDEERLRNKELLGVIRQPWVEALLRAGPTSVRRLVEETKALDLRLPRDESEIPLLWRYHELAPRALDHLVAARSRADLLSRYEPGPTSREWVIVLRALLQCQEDAPLSPSPLWDLCDLFARPQLQALAASHPDLAIESEQTLAAELSRRLHITSIESVREVPKLFHATKLDSWRQIICEAAANQIRHSQSSELAVNLAAELLRVAAPDKAQELVSAALDPLSRHERTAAFRLAMEGPPAHREDLLTLGYEVAKRTVDPELLFTVWKMRDDPLRGLYEATRLVLAYSHFQPELLEPLLRDASAADCLTWALATADLPLRDTAATYGAAAVTELGITLAQVAERSREAPNGDRVFAACAANLPFDSLSSVLKNEPVLATRLVRAALAQQPQESLDRVATAALYTVPPESCIQEEVRTALEELGPLSPLCRCYVRYIGPILLQKVCLKTLKREDASPWLRLPALHEWLSGVSPGEIFYALTISSRGASLAPFAEALEEILAPAGSERVAWAIDLLRILLDAANAEQLEQATSGLVCLLQIEQVPLLDRKQLAAEILKTVRITPPRSGYRLVELAFPIVYPDMAKGRKGPFWHALAGPDYHWDRAKSWRHWLIDTWVEQGWPPDTFWHCLCGDRVLLDGLVRRAAKSSQGKRFLELLAKTTPELSVVVARHLGSFW